MAPRTDRMMSDSLVCGRDVADWLGAKEGGVFNFHPSVRPVPMQVLSPSLTYSFSLSRTRARVCRALHKLISH